MRKKHHLPRRTCTTAVATALLLLLAGCATPPAADPSPSPYTDQVDAPVRGLSQEELEDLLAGRGAGFARPAELNGHPGPLHVLELAQELGLTRDQEARFQDLYERMQAEARVAGRAVVDAHAALEEAFRAGDLDEEALAGRVADLEDAYGAYRFVHLRYHLLSKPLLTDHQRMEYDRLRGYDAGHDGAGDHGGH